MVSMAQLRSANLIFKFAGDDELRESLLSLAGGCPLVQSLHLHLEDVSRSTIKISFHSIEPLLQFTRLSRLGIYSSNTVELTPNIIARMANAWKGLMELELSMRARKYAGGGLRHLADFALGFLALTTLAVPLYFRELPATEHLTSSFRSLTALDVGSPRLESGHVQPVAEFLAALCPPGVEIRHARRPACPENWALVESLIRMIHRVYVQRVYEDRHRRAAR